MRLLLVAAVAFIATPALAQFPPPGLYTCTDKSGAGIGELSLFVAGDYSFKGTDGNSASGQIASAANSVNPLSGPLKDMELVGTFATDDAGKTVFAFTGPGNATVTCR